MAANQTISDLYKSYEKNRWGSQMLSIFRLDIPTRITGKKHHTNSPQSFAFCKQFLGNSVPYPVPRLPFLQAGGAWANGWVILLHVHLCDSAFAEPKMPGGSRWLDKRIYSIIFYTWQYGLRNFMNTCDHPYYIILRRLAKIYVCVCIFCDLSQLKYILNDAKRLIPVEAWRSFAAVSGIL